MPLDAEFPTRDASARPSAYTLTPAEREAFATLPAELPDASAALEDAVVRALVRRQLLALDARPADGSARHVVLRLARWLGAAAIVFTVFGAGIAVGRSSASAEEPAGPVAGAPMAGTAAVADSVQLGLLVQRAGTEYVNSLERVAAAPEGAGARAAVGREAARSTLRAAARQFARVAPDDPVAMLILERIRRADEHTAQRLWF